MVMLSGTDERRSNVKCDEIRAIYSIMRLVSRNGGTNNTRRARRHNGTRES